jgi:hypothetical protein
MLVLDTKSIVTEEYYEFLLLFKNIQVDNNPLYYYIDCQFILDQGIKLGFSAQYQYWI